MEHDSERNRILGRVDRGEEVLEAIKELCVQRGIRAATLTGIGAVRDAVIGYYDLDTHSYLTKEVAPVCEVVSLMGNVALLDGEPFVHAHVVLAAKDFSVLGGHLLRATCAVTMEIALDAWDGAAARAFDSEVKLNLLDPQRSKKY